MDESTTNFQDNHSEAQAASLSGFVPSNYVDIHRAGCAASRVGGHQFPFFLGTYLLGRIPNLSQIRNIDTSLGTFQYLTRAEDLWALAHIHNVVPPSISNQVMFILVAFLGMIVK